MLRLIAVAVIGYLFIVGAYKLAFSLSIIAAFSDALDGYLARKLNSISQFGEIIDPVADKCLVIMLALLLWSSGQLPSWWLILALLYDASSIIGYGLIRIAKTAATTTPTMIGKLARLTQFILLLLLMGDLAFPQTVMATIAVGFLYLSATMIGCSLIVYGRRAYDENRRAIIGFIFRQ